MGNPRIPESLIWTPTFCHKSVIKLVLHPFTCALKPPQNTLTPICPSASELNGAKSIYQMWRNATETQGEINSSEKLPAVFSHGPLRKRCRKSLSHQISERNQKPLHVKNAGKWKQNAATQHGNENMGKMLAPCRYSVIEQTLLLTGGKERVQMQLNFHILFFSIIFVWNLENKMFQSSFFLNLYFL